MRIENSAARLVCAEPVFSHVTPLLHRLHLHWLRVARRITYKFVRRLRSPMARRLSRPICAVAVATTMIFGHQPTVTSLCDGRWHALLIVLWLLQDLPHGTHFRFTSGRLSLMHKLTVPDHVPDWLKLYHSFVFLRPSFNYFVRRCWAQVEWRHIIVLHDDDDDVSERLFWKKNSPVSPALHRSLYRMFTLFTSGLRRRC